MANEKTGTDLMREALPQVTRLDAALNEIMRIADNHGTAMNMARRYGNQYGDEDRVRATRGMIEAVIRRLGVPAELPPMDDSEYVVALKDIYGHDPGK